MTGDQANSDIVELSNGDFVVTWHSLGQNGYRSEARAQIFDRIGEGWIQNQNCPDSGTNDFAAWYTSIAKTNDGGFVVTWESDGQDGSSASEYSYKNLIKTSVKVGNTQRVNTYTRQQINLILQYLF